MLGFLKRLFGMNPPKPTFTEEEYEQHYEAKQAALEKILGPMHEMVFHAIIPFAIGGTVDMYCFPNGIPGVGFATMELIEPNGSGPKPNEIGTYELVAFTKCTLPAEGSEEDENHPFNKMLNHLCGILTTVGNYSYSAILNPKDTCEVPMDEGEPNLCLVFDEYNPANVGFTINGQQHGLLLCLEVFRQEMEYARKHGSEELLNKLKEAGHYPYSDLERESVV